MSASLADSLDKLAANIGHETELGLLAALHPIIGQEGVLALTPFMAKVSARVSSAYREALQTSLVPELQRLAASGYIPAPLGDFDAILNRTLASSPPPSSNDFGGNSFYDPSQGADAASASSSPFTSKRTSMNWPTFQALPMLGSNSSPLEGHEPAAGPPPGSHDESDASPPNFFSMPSSGSGSTTATQQSWQQLQDQQELSSLTAESEDRASAPLSPGAGFRGLTIASPQHQQHHHLGDGLSSSAALSADAAPQPIGGHHKSRGGGGDVGGVGGEHAITSGALPSLQQHIQAQEILLMMSTGGTGSSGTRSPVHADSFSPPPSQRLSPVGSVGGGGAATDPDLLSLLQKNLMETLSAASTGGSGTAAQQQYDAARSAEMFRLHHYGGCSGSPPNIDFSSTQHNLLMQGFRSVPGTPARSPSNPRHLDFFAPQQPGEEDFFSHLSSLPDLFHAPDLRHHAASDPTHNDSLSALLTQMTLQQAQHHHHQHQQVPRRQQSSDQPPLLPNFPRRSLPENPFAHMVTSSVPTSPMQQHPTHPSQFMSPVSGSRTPNSSSQSSHHGGVGGVGGPHPGASPRSRHQQSPSCSDWLSLVAASSQHVAGGGIASAAPMGGGDYSIDGSQSSFGHHGLSSIPSRQDLDLLMSSLHHGSLLTNSSSGHQGGAHLFEPRNTSGGGGSAPTSPPPPPHGSPPHGTPLLFSCEGFTGGEGGGAGQPPYPVVDASLPARFKALAPAVQLRILSLTSASNVISIKDFDDKVVNKMAMLVEAFSSDEAISMLAHLEHRMRTKQGVMKNGPGYLDVAVSSHLDMLKAQGSCPKSMSVEEYASGALSPRVFLELKDAVASNRWLKWQHLDQGIVQLVKKLPNEGAIEKLQEIRCHSFKNVDNIKGCIMSILNSKIREDRRKPQ